MSKQSEEQRTEGLAEGWPQCRWEGCTWLVNPEWEERPQSWGSLWIDPDRVWRHRHNTPQGAAMLSGRGQLQATVSAVFEGDLAEAARQWASEPSAENERQLLEELVSAVAGLASTGNQSSKLKALDLLSSGLSMFKRTVPEPPRQPVLISLSDNVTVALMRDLRQDFELRDGASGELVMRTPAGAEWEGLEWRLKPTSSSQASATPVEL